MAATRTFSLRWCHRYRLYFVIFSLILVIQLLLALNFYRIHENSESPIVRRNSGSNAHKTNHGLDYDSPSIKFSDDYLVDDEDSPSNLFDKGLKDSSSRNMSPRESEKYRNAHVALPADKDLQDLRVQSSTRTNGTRRSEKMEEFLNLDELDFKPSCNISIREAISAIHRATTQACKHELANITCLMQQGILYPERLPRHCPLQEYVKHDANFPAKEEITDHVRIAFLLTINGRAVRQVTRLIKALYHDRHYFYIHVDSRQDYLYRELKELEKTYPNIRLSRIRLSTIWGGASLLQMLLGCISELLSIREWSWDYVINLSESDFPIKSITSLEHFLASNKGKNFVKSHGQDTQRFIAKQGLDKTFYECDTHMWRLGDRTLPWGIRVDGGSDWIALHRDFCDYVTSHNDTLLHGLLTVFRYTLLPAESFFHTVLQNSQFCETVIDNNLHVTNWKRKMGCKCQYKHIVDWCGCSPNDFKPEDWPRLQATEDRPYFFARKFEPIINQQIIEQMETWIYGARKGVMTNIDSYWQNDYHSDDKSPLPDDARISIYESFSRLGAKQLESASNLCKVKFHSVQEATLYNVNDIFKGILVLYKVPIPSEETPVILETQLRPIQHYTVYKSIGPAGRLKLLQVGSDFDHKELVFRNMGRILGPFSEPGALHKWGAGAQLSATFVWVDPTNTVAGSYEVKIEPGSQVLYHKPTFRQPLRPGIWSLKLMYNWVLTAETLFLVTPLAMYNGRRLSGEQVKFLHNGPGQAYIDHDFSNVETILGFTNKSIQQRQALANSRRYGRDLTEWTDSLASTFWSVQDTCFVAQPRHPLGGVICKQLDLVPCHLTQWSSKASDPKSNLLGSDKLS